MISNQLRVRDHPIVSPTCTHAVVISDARFVPENEWNWPPRVDAYLLDLEGGEIVSLARSIRSQPAWSPNGRYVAWWSRADESWNVYDVSDGRFAIYDVGEDGSEQNTIAALPDSAGRIRWPDTGSIAWIEGRQSLHRIDLTSQAARHVRFTPDPRSTSQQANPVGGAPPTQWHWPKGGGDVVFAVATDPATRDSSVYRCELSKLSATLLHKYNGRVKLRDVSSDARSVLLTRERFDVFPDLWLINPDQPEPIRVTDANPQQLEYRWGTSRIIEWKSPSGKNLHGSLLIPDGVNPVGELPMVVYFYDDDEFRNRHTYESPRARSSNINPSVYVSRGYAVFIPNVELTIGSPAESAAASVLSGIDAVINTGFVNPNCIGLQAHSYGAFLAASLLTRTKRFSAAVLSAPVTDTVSSYLSLRESGTRANQYEVGQSRFGGTPWQIREAYLKQSPVLDADRISTPLLMMANPKDDAVPPAQGMELFLALRRLGKPAWLVSYPDEGHGLRNPLNRLDWANRMESFFDLHLRK